VNVVEAVFRNDFKWAFREQTVVDFEIYAQVEVFEKTATQEVDIVIIRVWVSELGKSYTMAEDYFENGAPDPEPPEWWGMAAGLVP
jgi:hypothetical protein